ncbi:MAG: glycerophosphodiester phosphodiesterase family protein [Planctomycetia bacterium]|nr:glycerophosphodiester phosphodiesterase family protein [Planctomycetia bacterium]
MKCIGIFCLVLCLLSLSERDSWGQEGPAGRNTSGKKVSIVAHRGFSWKAPENTLASAREAFAVGADGSECDLRRSTDGVIYLFHDESTGRYESSARPVSTLSWSELAQLDTAALDPRFSPYQGEPVPTFDAWLDLFQDCPCQPIIEVKEDGFEKEVITAIRRRNMESKATIIDFSASRVRQYRELAPEIAVAWLCSWDSKKVTQEEIHKIVMAQVAELDVKIIDIYWANLTPELVDDLHSLGVQVWCWTVDRPDDMKKVIEMGVDSVTTNRPDLTPGH